MAHEISISDGVSVPKCTKEALNVHLGKLTSVRDGQFDVSVNFDNPCDNYSRELYEQFRTEAKESYPHVTINYPWNDEDE